MITINGSRADNTYLTGAKLTRRADSIAVRGFVRSELILTFRGEIYAEPDDPVSISFDNTVFSVHYIDSITRQGDSVTINATDLMRNTDRCFQTEIPEEIHTPSFVSAIARECGFTGAENVPDVCLCGTDVKGKTVRQILKDISEDACGVWYCTNSGALRFIHFCDSACMVSSAQYSHVYLHSVYGPFTGVRAQNRLSGKIYTSGTGGVRSVVSVAGRGFTTERTRALASSLAGKRIQSFYCGHIELDEATEGITSFLLGENVYTACVTEIYFGAVMYARAYTKDISSTPRDEVLDMLRESRLYGSAVIDTDGIAITEETEDVDIRLRAKHGFSAVADGVTTFDGAVIDGVMPTLIEHISATSERIVYGGSSYILSYDEHGGRKTNIRLRKEEH